MRASRLPSALLASAALVAASAVPAAAAPAVDGEFAVDGTPGPLTLGSDGNVWVTLSGGDADIAKIAPDGTVTSYRDARLSNAGGIVSGPDGNLWISRTDEIVRFAPADPEGTDSAIALPTLDDPRGITSDGRVVWAASGDQLFRVDPATNSATRTRVDGMGARGAAIGADGRVLIADFDSGRIVSLDPAALDRPAFTDVGGGPQEVAGGSGATFAYTNPNANPQEVGVVTPPGAALRVPTPMTDPAGIALGDDGAWWIARFTGEDLARLTPDGAITTLRGFSAAAGPRRIARGAGGTLWVSLEVARRVARVTGIEAPRVDPPRADPPRSDPPRSGGGPTPDRTAPRLVLLRRGRRVTGARVQYLTFTVDEPAAVRISLLKETAGVRKRGRCVRPPRRPARVRACTYRVVVGSRLVQTRSARGLRVRVVRRDRGKFTAGTYRFIVRATDAAHNTAVRSLDFTLRRRR